MSTGIVTFDHRGFKGDERPHRRLIALVADLERDLPTLGTAAAAIADTAELVWGFEDIKLRNVAVYQTRPAELGYPTGVRLAGLLGPNNRPSQQ